MKYYELIPADGRKSFYGKALIEINEDGSETLYSYGTKIITRTSNGEFVKHWDGWTATTGRHIKAFCDMNKAQYNALPMQDSKPTGSGSGGRVLTNSESYAAMIGRRYAG